MKRDVFDATVTRQRNERFLHGSITDEGEVNVPVCTSSRFESRGQTLRDAMRSGKRDEEVVRPRAKTLASFTVDRSEKLLQSPIGNQNGP